jgi:hypothetical protein
LTAPVVALAGACTLVDSNENTDPSMGLSDFITLEEAKIMAEFEAFAKEQLPAAADMNVAALRDHARQVLSAIALGMRQPQTDQEQHAKSLGHASKADSADKPPVNSTGRFVLRPVSMSIKPRPNTERCALR